MTADSGDDSMLVVWDSFSGTPVRTFLNPHPNGICTLDLSADDKYIATLGADSPQTVSIWDWSDESRDGPIQSLRFVDNKKGADGKSGDGSSSERLTWIKFNPENAQELAVNGDHRVAFLHWSDTPNSIVVLSPQCGSKEFPSAQKESIPRTKTVFLPGSDKAVTGTEGGDILVWEVSKIKTGIGQPGDRKLEKVVPLNPEVKPGVYIPINILLTV